MFSTVDWLDAPDGCDVWSLTLADLTTLAGRAVGVRSLAEWFNVVIDMLRNVEIKAKVRDLGDTVSKAKKLSNSEGTWIKQDDIFFRLPQGRGRLKLRTFEVSCVQIQCKFSSFLSFIPYGTVMFCRTWEVRSWKTSCWTKPLSANFMFTMVRGYTNLNYVRDILCGCTYSKTSGKIQHSGNLYCTR